MHPVIAELCYDLFFQLQLFHDLIASQLIRSARQDQS